jgi:MFS family permease
LNINAEKEPTPKIDRFEAEDHGLHRSAENVEVSGTKKKNIQGGISSKMTTKFLLISSVFTGFASGVFMFCMRQTVQYQWLFFTFAMIFATYTVIAITFPVLHLLLNKWINLFEVFAVRVAAKNWKSMRVVADALQILAITSMVALSAVSILGYVHFLQYIILFILMFLPVAAFSRKTALEIDYTPIISRFLTRFPFRKVYEKILSNHFLRRIVYAIQEMVSVRTLWLGLMVYISSLIFFSPLFRNETRITISIFSMTVIAFLLAWVYSIGNGKERLRTRQIVAKIVGFVLLLICTAHDVFQTQNAFAAAYFVAVLSVYTFADSTINKMLDDKIVFNEWKSLKYGEKMLDQKDKRPIC